MNFLFSPAIHASHILNILYIRKTTIAILGGSLEKVSPRLFKTSPKKCKSRFAKLCFPYFTPIFEIFAAEYYIAR